MTEHIDRDDRAVVRALLDTYPDKNWPGEDIRALLDALELQEKITAALRVEARVMRQRISDLAQEVRDERGAALDQIEQVRIRDAQIQAVRDVLERHEAIVGDTLGVPVERIRRALDGDSTN